MTHSRFSRRAFFGRAAAAPLAGAEVARSEIPAKGWVIVERHWGYNDEYTYEEEGVQLHPKVYLDRSAAETECRRLCEVFFAEIFPTPAAFEPDWELFPNCDPETATWRDLRQEGFPDPYFIEEVEL